MRGFRQFLSSSFRNNYWSFFKLLIIALIGTISLFFWQSFARMQDINDGGPPRSQHPSIFNVNPRQAVITTGIPRQSNSNALAVFSDPLVSPGSQTLVTGFPDDVIPQSLSYYGSDNALVGAFGDNGSGVSEIFVLQVSTATIVSTINTAPSGYEGTGTIAVTPDLTAALAMGKFTFTPTQKLYVIHAPFGPSSPISSVTLPGYLASGQTQAIVFNSAGRAFVYHTTGISVLDAPYTSIAFTIPTPFNGTNGGIAISPDGNTLLTTEDSENIVHIFKAPFSAATTGSTLIIPNGNGLDGIGIAPDGSSAIVTSTIHQAAVIAAPFSSNSVVSELTLPPGQFGFEDVSFSADSQIAILAGFGPGEPPVFVRAPFNGNSVTTSVPIQGPHDPGRGFGAARFLPAGFGPGLTVSMTGPGNVLPGANLTYTISYANTGVTPATNVIIRDPLPSGTTFVSATGGGTLNGGNVVFNIGALPAGSATQTVSFTVTVNAPSGTILNSGYTIEGDGVTPIPGPPVATNVGAATPTPTPTPTPTGTPTPTPTPVPTPTPPTFDFNATRSPIANTIWDPSITAVGWYITPTASLNLTRIETNFLPGNGADRNVTVELLTDRRSAGGTLLGSFTFNSTSARGHLGGGTFTPVAITSGTTYFIGFRGVSGIGINTTSDPGAVNCGACLYLDNASSAEGQYQTRGGSNVASVIDQPILRLIGTAPPAVATVSGKVVGSDGRGLRSTTVSLTDSLGIVRTATTSSFGFFSFDNVATGQTYTVRVSSRLYRFSPRTVTVSDNLTLADLVGLE